MTLNNIIERQRKTMSCDRRILLSSEGIEITIPSIILNDSSNFIGGNILYHHSREKKENCNDVTLSVLNDINVPVDKMVSILSDLKVSEEIIIPTSDNVSGGGIAQW